MLSLIFCIQLAPSAGLFDLSPMKIAYIITSASLIPLLAMHDVSRLTPLAMAGSGASICVALAVLSLLGIDPGRTKLPLQPPAGHAIVDWPVGLLQSIGIFAVSMSGHTTLPAVRKAMLRPERFQTSVAGAFAIMVTLYAVVGGFGYWYWGDDVSPVAIYDLATNSPYARVRGATSWYQWIGIDRVLAALVLITCSAKVPALIFVIQELLLGAVHPTGVLNFKEQYAARLVVAASAFALAAAARNSLGSVLGLVGGACSMTVSLVLPVLFYMQLTWRRTALPRRVGLVTFAAFAVCLLVVVTGLNLQAMINNDDRRRRHPDDAFGFVEPQLLSH